MQYFFYPTCPENEPNQDWKWKKEADNLFKDAHFCVWAETHTVCLFFWQIVETFQIFIFSLNLKEKRMSLF